MALKKRIPASSIAEMVIALTIIAICFAVASQVFLQSSRSTILFKEVKEQTEYQSLLLDALVHDTLPDVREWKGELGSIEMHASGKDSVIFRDFTLYFNQRSTWEQAFFCEE